MMRRPVRRAAGVSCSLSASLSRPPYAVRSITFRPWLAYTGTGSRKSNCVACRVDAK